MIIIIAIIIIILYLCLEKYFHIIRLNSIPIRIHVNGTRGKSSIVKLLTQALQSQGIRTVAKMTGDSPILYSTDGVQSPFPRKGSARMQEQIELIKIATAQHAQAIVVECMALQPEFQEISETEMIHATHTIITNIRRDHAEVMGLTIEDVAGCLALSLPHHGTLICQNQNDVSLLFNNINTNPINVLIANKETNNLLIANQETNDVLNQNINKIVELVLQDLGVAKAHNCVDTMTLPRPLSVNYLDHNFVFLDLFSVNDIDSFTLLLENKREDLPGPLIVIFNTRADRPLRTLSFIEYFKKSQFLTCIVLVGSHVPWAKRQLRECQYLDCRHYDISRIMQILTTQYGKHVFTIIGAGNFKGIGETFRVILGKEKDYKEKDYVAH